MRIKRKWLKEFVRKYGPDTGIETYLVKDGIGWYIVFPFVLDNGKCRRVTARDNDIICYGYTLGIPEFVYTKKEIAPIEQEKLDELLPSYLEYVRNRPIPPLYEK